MGDSTILDPMDLKTRNGLAVMKIDYAWSIGNERCGAPTPVVLGQVDAPY